MAAPPPSSLAYRLIVALAAFVIIVAGLKAAAAFVVPILLAAFVTIITAPILYWLRVRGVPTWAAFLALVVVIVLVALTLVSVIGSSVTDFTARLPSYASELKQQRDLLIEWVDEHMLERFDDEEAAADTNTSEPVPPATSPTDEQPSPASEQLRNALSVDRAMALLSALLSGLTSALSNVFLILLLVVFMLLETSSLPARLQLLPKFSDETEHRLDEILRRVRHYMTIKTLISLLTGLLVTVLLLILGIEYAALWGILAFILNFVPNVGSIIAAIPPMAIALIQHGLGSMAMVAIGFVVINMAIGNVIEPRVLGRGLGMSTLVVILSLVFWGWVLGPIGMLLSVPLTMVMQIVFESTPETRWLAVLMGSATESAHPSTA